MSTIILFKQPGLLSSPFYQIDIFQLLQVNPPHYIPLVELIPAPWTEKSIIERTRAIMKDIGQAPVTLNKEVNGFLLNRLQYAIIMEGWRLVEVI